MIEKLMGMADGRFVVPLVLAVGLSVVAKAVFGLHRSKSQDRRDFLELWGARQAPDDLWLEVAVRHQFGQYLPASLIRSLQQSPQAARALSDVALSWDLLDMDDETGEINWCVERYKRPLRRKWERRIFLGLYFVLSFCGLMLAYFAILAGSSVSWSVWLCIVILLVGAFWSLARTETITVAERSITRWLGGSSRA